MHNKINDLIGRGRITPTLPNTIPHNPSNFSYIPTKTIYSLDLRTPQEIEAAKKRKAKDTKKK